MRWWVTLAVLLWGWGMETVMACKEGQTCSADVEVTWVTYCSPHKSGDYCVQETKQTTESCFSEAAGCYASTPARKTACSSVADGCIKIGRDDQVSCCSGSGGNGGPGALPVCNPGEVVIDDVPEVRECISRGDCLWGPDGTGGIAGRLTGESECATNPLRYPCIRGHCGLPCSCTTTPGQCGNTINGCGYEQRVQVKDCTPAGCEMQARPFVHSRL